MAGACSFDAGTVATCSLALVAVVVVAHTLVGRSVVAVEMVAASRS